jgi:anti-anti-sigma factor
MEIQYSELDNNIRLIRLMGKLDILGTGQVETRFTGYCAGNNVRVVVDLSEVEFLASIGVRLLILTAKSIHSRGGKMVLLSPIPEVQHVLEVTGMPAVVPIYSHLESAEAVLTAL